MVKFYASLSYSHDLNLKVPHSLLHVDTWFPASVLVLEAMGQWRRQPRWRTEFTWRVKVLLGSASQLGSLCEERPSKVWRALGSGSQSYD